MARVKPDRTGAWHRREAATLFGSYPTRFLLSLAASVALITLCFHLPLDVSLRPVGWQLNADADQPMLDLVDVKTEPDRKATDAGTPITTFGVEEDLQAGEDEDAPPELEEPLPSPVAPPPAEKLKVRQAVLDHAEKPPDIVGGLGAYYIHIEYPEEAIVAGIQGRLLLTFVVETDGRPSQIEVLKSLHASCDSSAVRALRKTRFVPGRQNGQAVRVRMRLPVQFKLIDPVRPADKDSSASRTASSIEREG